MNTNEIIHKIVAYLPNEKIKFSRRKVPFNNINGNQLIVEFIHRLDVFHFNENSSWRFIKKTFDDYFKDPDYIPECPICFKNSNKTSACSECCIEMCSECLLDIIKSNKGILKCPFCRHESGEELNDNDLFDLVAKTRCRWNIHNF